MTKNTSQKNELWLRQYNAEINAPRKVGAIVASKTGHNCRIARIEGDIVHLDNGESMHISKVRSGVPADSTCRR